MGDFGDGLHPLRTSDAHLRQRERVTSGPINKRGSKLIESYFWYPQSTADVRPFRARTRGFHGTALLWAQQALRGDAEDAGPAQPVPERDFYNSVTGLGGE